MVEVMSVQPTSEKRTVEQLAGSAAKLVPGNAKIAVVKASVLNANLSVDVDVDFISLSINRAVLTVDCFSGSGC
ncbi:hypothetical protein D3C81_1801400 [compost metagenome]